MANSRRIFRDRLEIVWRGIVHVARLLRSGRTGLAGVAGVLAIAIAIATAMFAIVDALLLRPVPFRDPARLAHLDLRGEHGGSAGVPAVVFDAWKQSIAFSGVEAALNGTAYIHTDGGVLTRRMARVTPGTFGLLGGVRPVVGRLFQPGDGALGVEDRVLVSEDFWRSVYRADPAIVGRTLQIDSRTAIVVGVLPADFRFPEWNTEIWRADQFRAAAGTTSDPVDVYVRFASAMPVADALRVATVASQSAAPDPARSVVAASLADEDHDKDYKRAISLLVAGVVLLFLLLCANASGLLLTSLVGRATEFEVRSALGASRARLIGQSVLECGTAGVVALVGGAALGWGLVRIARVTLPTSILRQTLNPLDFDGRALAVTAFAALVAVLCAGVLPAVIGTRIERGRGPGLGDRSGGETRQARTTSRILLVAQIAISCTLLLGATLLVRSVVKLMTADRGLDTRGIVVARVVLPTDVFTTDAARTTAARQLEAAARAVSGVQRTSWSYGTPPGGGVNSRSEWLSDKPGATPLKMVVNQFLVDPDFFTLYELHVVKGRPFTVADGAESVLVSERFAQILWPGEEAVGRQFSLDRKRTFQIVGIVNELHYPSLDTVREAPQVYLRFKGVSYVAMLSVRCATSCPDTALIRERLMAAQPGVTVADVRSLEDSYRAEVVRPRAAAVLAFTFAVTAMISAAIGVFSLLSRHIARRRHELGIRTALGATPARLGAVVWRESLLLTLPGLAIGTLAGIWSTRLVSSLLFNVTTADPLSWFVVIGTIAATVAAASWRPVRIATRTNPLLLLREG